MKLPSAEELAEHLVHLECEHTMEGHCEECTLRHLKEHRDELLEAVAEVVQAREVENGTAAEGENEPWFTIHLHTEAHLHNAVADIRKLKEKP